MTSHETRAEPERADAADEWMTVPDAAERMGVPVTRIRQYLNDGAMAATRRGGTAPISPLEIERFAAARHPFIREPKLEEFSVA